MTELHIIYIALGSGIVVTAIGALIAYGKLIQKIEYISTTTDGLIKKFDNHLKHEITPIQKEIACLRTEIALLKVRMDNSSKQLENLVKVIELLREDRT